MGQSQSATTAMIQECHCGHGLLHIASHGAQGYVAKREEMESETERRKGHGPHMEREGVAG